jgi:hypothetical protein
LSLGAQFFPSLCSAQKIPGSLLCVIFYAHTGFQRKDFYSRMVYLWVEISCYLLMELEAGLSYVMSCVLFSVNALVLLTERTAFVRTTGCKEQPDKSRYNITYLLLILVLVWDLYTA